MKLKLNNINLIHTITAIVMVFDISGCAKELDELGGMKPSDVISFTTTLPSQSTKANATELSGSGMSLYTSGNLAAEEVSLSGNSLPAVATKGAPATQLAGTAGIIGYLKGTDDVRLWSALNNKEFRFDGDELKNTGANVSWKAAESETDATHLRIYAFAPKTAIPNETSATDDALKLTLPDNGKNLTDAPTLTYTVPADIDKQQDLLVAFTEVATNFRMSIPLQFNHILTGIRFKAGFECTIKSVELKNIVSTGTYTMGGQWDLGTTVADFSTDNTDDTFFLLPQAFEGTYTEDNEPAVVMTYTENGSTENKTIKAGLKDLEWEAGKLITYTIYKENAKPSYIFFDLAAGDVKITAENYSGKIYKDGIAEDVTGNYSNNHIYYVYQSSESDTKYNKENTGYKTGSSECRIPDYDAVMYENRPWRDWIINNKDVVKVIEVWDDSKNLGVTQIENYTEGYQNTAVVRDVGRTHTQNRILVTGGNVTGEGAFNCKLIIDDIYINYSDGSTGYRKEGAITYKPTNNSAQLHIHTKGDNRVGNIHYCNFNEANTPSLIFEGEGSLTVADTDFKTGKYDNDNFPYGYYSNHHESAIGGSDEEENDRAYGIVFKSGIIYAGTTLAENCTAIGGGGNEVGGITIEGGVVTAVTSTTGTAIGGGIGFSSEGGVGNVVIRGGYVYAYNLGNPVDIPSAAIGGAGSSNSYGSKGNVEISGGYVYAESVLGTAIGGGSSKTQIGGSANVIISGGTVIAKSIGKGTLKAGAGIGGGTGCSGGNKEASDLNGGDATITISGNPVIRTGSVGGGATGAKNSKIGSATINISGTPDIQAQFVMAKGADNAPSFTMSGGTIRNSHTTDQEYVHIQDKGGAVYMEEGTLTMTGGTITSCSAVEGGAIYITGGSASISGDAIIKGNLASAGNGGGVCIYNGNFSMDGSAEISNNSSQFRTLPGNSNGTGGNGGGIYVSSSDNATVSILRGTIKGNTADRNGGGIAVDMSANNEKTAKITIGKADAGDTDPDISGNTTLILGGGLYASGAKAEITINSGKIMDNSTSGYTYNVNVANEGGTVTLNGGNVTHQVVTFNANGGNINGAATAQQKIVTSTNSLLKAPVPTRTGYNFNGWNTRQDGNGTPYADGATMNLSADLTLYAQWQIIQ